MINLRWITFNLRCCQKFAWNYGLIKFASNISCFSEIWSNSNYSSSSSYWALSRINIKKIRWPVIIENIVIICILLVIEGNLYDWLSKYVWGWRVTNNFCWVNYCSRHLCEVLKHTKRIISVINAFILEREEVSTS